MPALERMDPSDWVLITFLVLILLMILAVALLFLYMESPAKPLFSFSSSQANMWKLKQPQTSRPTSIPNSRSIPSNFSSSHNATSRYQPERPKTSHSNYARSVNSHARAKSQHQPRAKNVWSNREEEAEAEPQGKNGTTKLPQLPRKTSSGGILPKSVRHVQSFAELGSMREVSLSSDFAKLSLGDKLNRKRTVSGEVCRTRSTPATESPRVVFKKPESALPTLQTPVRVKRRSSVVPPETPVLRTIKEMRETVQSIRASASPAKSPCPRHFLTKDSNVTNLTGFTAWDVDERLGDFDSKLRDMDERFSNSLDQRKLLEEAVQMAKSRGKTSVWNVYLDVCN